MVHCFVNAKNQSTAHVFWFWWLRMYGHVAVRSSPATYGKCNIRQFGGSRSKVVRRHQAAEKPERELYGV